MLEKWIFQNGILEEQEEALGGLKNVLFSLLSSLFDVVDTLLCVCIRSSALSSASYCPCLDGHRENNMCELPLSLHEISRSFWDFVSMFLNFSLVCQCPVTITIAAVSYNYVRLVSYFNNYLSLSALYAAEFIPNNSAEWWSFLAHSLCTVIATLSEL